MRGRYGERIRIYSEDSSVPTQENEFGFVRLIFITKDGIEHEKITYYFVTGNVRLLCPSLRKDGFS